MKRYIYFVNIMTKIVDLTKYKKIIFINGLNFHLSNELRTEINNGDYLADIGFDIHKFFNIEPFHNIGGSKPLCFYNFDNYKNLFTENNNSQKSELLSFVLEEFYCSKLRNLFNRKDILYITSLNGLGRKQVGNTYIFEGFAKSLKDYTDPELQLQLDYLRKPGVLIEINNSGYDQNKIITLANELIPGYNSDLNHTRYNGGSQNYIMFYMKKLLMKEILNSYIERNIN